MDLKLSPMEIMKYSLLLSLGFFANSQEKSKILLREQETGAKDFYFQMSDETVKEAECSKIAIHLSFLLRSIILLGNSY